MWCGECIDLCASQNIHAAGYRFDITEPNTSSTCYTGYHKQSRPEQKKWCKTCIFIWWNRLFFIFETFFKWNFTCVLIRWFFRQCSANKTIDFFDDTKLKEKRAQNSRPELFLLPLFMQHSICALLSSFFFLLCGLKYQGLSAATGFHFFFSACVCIYVASAGSEFFFSIHLKFH